MAKNWGKYRELGVEIPSDLEPEDWTLYVMCAPSGVEWRRAVHSAVRLLSRGRFWARDDRQDSIKTAALIGGEIERSLMACNIDFTVLADSIKYLADNLQVQQSNSQTVTCGGGGGGGGGGGDVLDEPIDQPEDIPVDIIPPAPDSNQSAMTNQEKCSVAAYLADSWVDTFVTIENTWAGVAVTITTVTAWAQEKFPAGSVLPFVAMIITSLAVALETALLASLAGNMSDAAQSMRDDLECAVAGATSAADAKKRFEAVIANTRAQYGKVTYTVLILVAQMLDWNKIMGGEVIVPTSYDTATCCGQVTGYQYIPATFTAIVGEQKSVEITDYSITLEDNVVTATGFAPQAGRYLIPLIEWNDPPTITDGRYIGVRFTINLVNNSIARCIGANIALDMFRPGILENFGSGVIDKLRIAPDYPTAESLGIEHVEIGATVAPNFCDVLEGMYMRVGGGAVVAGQFTVIISNPFWIINNSLPCP